MEKIISCQIIKALCTGPVPTELSDEIVKGQPPGFCGICARARIGAGEAAANYGVYGRAVTVLELTDFEKLTLRFPNGTVTVVDGIPEVKKF